LREKNIEFPTVRNIAETVIEIRKAKLPDPEIIGNAGSFFKNPIIDIHQFSKLINDYPEVPNFSS
jgi:UDP-N-acetylmuramate dehydrogenase